MRRIGVRLRQSFRLAKASADKQALARSIGASHMFT
jgi:hypothetical protein